MQVSLAPYCLLIDYASLVIEVESCRSKEVAAPSVCLNGYICTECGVYHIAGVFFVGQNFNGITQSVVVQKIFLG